MESGSLVADTAKRILGDLADPQTVNRAKDDAWKAPAWAALEEAGLTLAWVPESLGGAGAELGDGFAVLREAGRNAAAVPLAETLLAGWLLTQAGIVSPKGAMSCGPARDGEKLTLAGNGTLSGSLRSVAFAKGAKHLAVLARREAGGLAVALIEASQARITDGTGIGGDPTQCRELQRGAAVGRQGRSGRARRAGPAADGCRRPRHADGRRAGGHPRPRRGIRQRARRLRAPDRQVPGGAAQPRDAGGRGGGGERRRRRRRRGLRPAASSTISEVAIAKVRGGEAAGTGAAIAHQVHGAMGFTYEHSLHHSTRRLWAWREEFGNEASGPRARAAWSRQRGADELWPIMARPRIGSDT